MAMIPLFRPYMSKEAVENAVSVLNSGHLTEGQKVKDFEHAFNTIFHQENSVALNSATSALELAYRLADIQEGDEVITPVLTCTATNLPLKRRGAKIIFADIDTDLNVSVQDIQRKITPRTKAIVFVHFGGNNRGLKEIKDLCDKHAITLIEDAAQALGSKLWGIGDFTCISFQAIKLITTGDGGMLVCKSKTHTDKARLLRWFGIDRENRDKDITEAGYKYHMNDINAAIGLGNLLHYDELVEHREKLATIYRSYGLFAHAWLAGGFADDQKTGLDFEIGQHHYRNDKYSVFGGKQRLPNMDMLEYKYFFVPYHHEVTEEQAHYIGKSCQKNSP